MDRCTQRLFSGEGMGVRGANVGSRDVNWQLWVTAMAAVQNWAHMPHARCLRCWQPAKVHKTASFQLTHCQDSVLLQPAGGHCSKQRSLRLASISHTLPCLTSSSSCYMICCRRSLDAQRSPCAHGSGSSSGATSHLSSPAWDYSVHPNLQSREWPQKQHVTTLDLCTSVKKSSRLESCSGDITVVIHKKTAVMGKFFCEITAVITGMGQLL